VIGLPDETQLCWPRRAALLKHPSAPHEPDLVSVIVTTRNSSRTLEACLRSIRGQTWPLIELILVDNGSTDATLEIAGRLADRVAMVGPERSAQRNHGARLAAGNHLLFIDSDMVLTPEVIADGIELLIRRNVPAVIIPEETFGEGFWAHCRMLERSCYQGDDAVEAARLYSREAFFAVGGFDLDLTGPEDWDLSRRVAQGMRLPRTQAIIRHDEGRVRLRTAYAKMRYYAPGYLRYIRKYRRGALRQANPVVRGAYLRHWRQLGRHPLLTAGMVGLKSAESAAVLKFWAHAKLLGRVPPGGEIYNA
jgi:glycosyltransferase involved in cell wall biosynthesis